MPNDDKDIWQAYAKGVKQVRGCGENSGVPPPLRGRLGGGSIDKSSDGNYGESPPPTPPVKGGGFDRSRGHINHTTLDRRTERALRQGAIQIDAKLDLHGMTQVEAYHALDRFMALQIKRGLRNLLIITGKGSLGQSVLRSSLPHWLETLPAASHILKLCPASPKHGGNGAFYVILKRRRDYEC